MLIAQQVPRLVGDHIGEQIRILAGRRRRIGDALRKDKGDVAQVLTAHVDLFGEPVVASPPGSPRTVAAEVDRRVLALAGTISRELDSRLGKHLVEAVEQARQNGVFLAFQGQGRDECEDIYVLDQDRPAVVNIESAAGIQDNQLQSRCATRNRGAQQAVIGGDDRVRVDRDCRIRDDLERVVGEGAAVACKDQRVAGQRHRQQAEAEDGAEVDVLASGEVDVDRGAGELAVEHVRAFQVDRQRVADEVAQVEAAGADVGEAEVGTLDVHVEVAGLVDDHLEHLGCPSARPIGPGAVRAAIEPAAVVLGLQRVVGRDQRGGIGRDPRGVPCRRRVERGVNEVGRQQEPRLHCLHRIQRSRHPDRPAEGRPPLRQSLAQPVDQRRRLEVEAAKGTDTHDGLLERDTALRTCAANSARRGDRRAAAGSRSNRATLWATALALYARGRGGRAAQMSAAAASQPSAATARSPTHRNTCTCPLRNPQTARPSALAHRQTRHSRWMGARQLYGLRRDTGITSGHAPLAFHEG